MAKKLPKTLPTAVKRLSAGPIEDVALQNKIRDTRPNAQKRKNYSPPFPPKSGARNPV